MSLLELLAAIAVTAVIAGVGVPALQHVSLNARRSAVVDGLRSVIQFARSSAQTRGATVILCKANDAARCDAGGDRWIVIDREEDRPLRVLSFGKSDVTLSNRHQFEFRPFPLRSTNGTISFCDPRGAQNERAIIISPAGRPRIDRPDDSSGLSACGRD